MTTNLARANHYMAKSGRKTVKSLSNVIWKDTSLVSAEHICRCRKLAEAVLCGAYQHQHHSKPIVCVFDHLQEVSEYHRKLPGGILFGL